MALLIVVQSLQAQSRKTWDNVLALTPGTRVEVLGFGKKDRAKGYVTAVNTGSLTVRTKDGERTFNRTQTRAVETVKARRTLWYVVGGVAAAGAALGTSLATAQSSKYCVGSNCGVFPKEPSTSKQLLVIGAATGAGFPFFLLGGNKTIYDAK